MWLAHYLPGLSSGLGIKTGQERAYQDVYKNLKSWLWTWLTNQCETKEEYRCNTALLSLFLLSDKVKNVCEGSAQKRLMDWVREYVEPYETAFAFHL